MNHELQAKRTMNDILNIILKDTFTLVNLKHRLRILKLYLLKAFFGNPGATTPQQKDLDWLNTLPGTFYKNFTKDNVYKIFDDLEKLISQLQVLTIYLPIETNENISLQIGSFARKTLQNPTLLLDTKLDPFLIAGPAFSWKGVYKDYSLRSRIEEKKEEILQNFKRFLK